MRRGWQRRLERELLVRTSAVGEGGKSGGEIAGTGTEVENLGEVGYGGALAGLSGREAVHEGDGALEFDDVGFALVETGELDGAVDGFFLEADFVDELVGERFVGGEDFAGGELVEVGGVSLKWGRPSLTMVLKRSNMSLMCDLDQLALFGVIRGSC